VLVRQSQARSESVLDETLCREYVFKAEVSSIVR